MKLTIVEAAEVFSSILIPEWLDDGIKVGEIGGVNVYAGEIRRLQSAVEEFKKDNFDAEIGKRLRIRNLIDAIRYVREQKDIPLKEAKQYVENSGINLGIRRATTIRDYSWPHAER